MNVGVCLLVDLSKPTGKLATLYTTYKLLWTSCKVQGAPKKMHHSNLYPISVLEVGFYFFFFHMCFIIRISSPFHLDIQTMPILNLNCVKNAKKLRGCTNFSHFFQIIESTFGNVYYPQLNLSEK